MVIKILPKSMFAEWVKHVADANRVIAPVETSGSVSFQELDADEMAVLAYETTILPPKKAFLPPMEVLVEFQMGNGRDKILPVFDDQPTVLLGVHTCDLHAIHLLDRIFTQEISDRHYLSRRENTTIVSMECLRPCSDYSFCKSMGTLSVPDAFDLHITDLGEDYALEVGSSAGLDLLWNFNSFRDPGEQDYARLDKVMSEKWSRFTYRLEPDVTELPSLLALKKDDPLWDELGEKCLSCGACNLVCPTCYCFDVQDHVSLDLRSGQRMRSWDSCQLPQFALVAGGHNFRASRSARIRHRFMRKGKYLHETYGRLGCVGCGRCAQACPVQITPISVFNQLARRPQTDKLPHGEGSA